MDAAMPTLTVGNGFTTTIPGWDGIRTFRT